MSHCQMWLSCLSKRTFDETTYSRTRHLEASILSACQQACTIRQDFEAVREAMRSKWSNGQVEGQVNRLKTIKRQMYGRAGFELLRIRVLAKSP